MAEAYRKNIVFPNKHKDPMVEYAQDDKGRVRMIETATYEGGRVECLRTGIFRADFPEQFEVDVTALDILEQELRPTVDFFLRMEAEVDKADVTNYEEVVKEIYDMIQALRKDNGKRKEEPLIYHA